MSYVQGSTYSLKNFNDIINYYNNYLRRLYANNDPIILSPYSDPYTPTGKRTNYFTFNVLYTWREA